MSRKVYLRVAVEMRDDGLMLPRRLFWEDGRDYDIDRVVAVRPAPAAKTGGQGDRYTVEILGRQRYLFFERCDDLRGPVVGRWFVEGRE